MLENHHKLDGDNTKEAVAQYRAPANIESISCMGKCVCIGLVDGQVCKLSLNTQKHFTCAMKPVCMELADRTKSKNTQSKKSKNTSCSSTHKFLLCYYPCVSHTPKNNLNADDAFGCEMFEEASLTSGTTNKTITFGKKVICSTMPFLWYFQFFGIWKEAVTHNMMLLF